MSYVTLRPNSSTNPTKQHQVVDYDDWMRYVNGESQAYKVADSFAKYSDAQAYCEKLNNPA
jgi:hypothetical protein